MKDLFRSLLFVYGVYVIGHTIQSAGTSFYPFNLYIELRYDDLMRYVFYDHQIEMGIPAGIIVAALCCFGLLKLRK